MKKEGPLCPGVDIVTTVNEPAGVAVIKKNAIGGQPTAFKNTHAIRQFITFMLKIGE